MQPSLAELTRAALPAVLAQGPLLAVIVSSENAKAYINHAPLRAVCFCLLYEVVVGVAIKVWKRLEEDTVKLLADAVRSLVGHTWAGLLGVFTPFRRRYLRQLVFDHRDFNVRGLLTIGTYNLRLDQAFVELQVLAIGHAASHLGVAGPLRTLCGQRHEGRRQVGGQHRTRGPNAFSKVQRLVARTRGHVQHLRAGLHASQRDHRVGGGAQPGSDLRRVRIPAGRRGIPVAAGVGLEGLRIGWR